MNGSQRSGEPFTVICVDLDGFKDVNDVRGHGAGDSVLRSLARRFEAIVRADDASRADDRLEAAGEQRGGCRRPRDRGRRSRP